MGGGANDNKKEKVDRKWNLRGFECEEAEAAASGSKTRNRVDSSDWLFSA